MDHEPVFITTLAIGLTAAFIGGFVARRLRLPAIVGYILAGVVIGPFTPGLIADARIAHGARRARRDPADVRRRASTSRSATCSRSGRIAIPGAIVQTVVAVAAGHVRWARRSGWASAAAGSRARRVDREHCRPAARVGRAGAQDTVQGHIAIGWLIVEDLLTVLVLVLLPRPRRCWRRGRPGGDDGANSVVGDRHGARQGGASSRS